MIQNLHTTLHRTSAPEGLELLALLWVEARRLISPLITSCLDLKQLVEAFSKVLGCSFLCGNQQEEGGGS